MPSKNKENIISQKHAKLFSVCYKEFGVTTDKKKIIKRIIILTNIVDKYQKIINTFENPIFNLDEYSLHIIRNIKNNMTIFKTKLSKLKSRV